MDLCDSSLFLSDEGSSGLLRFMSLRFQKRRGILRETVVCTDVILWFVTPLKRSEKTNVHCLLRWGFPRFFRVNEYTNF